MSMKANKFVFQVYFACVVCVSLLVLYGCGVQEVAVVVRNEYFESVHKVAVGVVSFGTLARNVESEPKMLPSGSWYLRAVTDIGLRLRARIRVEERTQVRITITNTGGVRIE